jgi:hypothetical protein
MSAIPYIHKNSRVNAEVTLAKKDATVILPLPIIHKLSFID